MHTSLEGRKQNRRDEKRRGKPQDGQREKKKESRRGARERDEGRRDAKQQTQGQPSHREKGATGAAPKSSPGKKGQRRGAPSEGSE